MRLDIDYPDVDNRREIPAKIHHQPTHQGRQPRRDRPRLASAPRVSRSLSCRNCPVLIHGGLESNDYSTEGWKAKWSDFDDSLTVVERMRSSTGRVIEPRIVDDEVVGTTPMHSTG